MSGNIITRREFNISRMAKEFPDTDINDIQRAQWELELEYPNTDWEEAVYYDTGKAAKRAPSKVHEVREAIKASPATIKKKQGMHKFPEKDHKKRVEIKYNGHKRVDLR